MKYDHHVIESDCEQTNFKSNTLYTELGKEKSNNEERILAFYQAMDEEESVGLIKLPQDDLNANVQLKGFSSNDSK